MWHYYSSIFPKNVPYCYDWETTTERNYESALTVTHAYLKHWKRMKISTEKFILHKLTNYAGFTQKNRLSDKTLQTQCFMKQG